MAERREGWDSWRRRSGLDALAGHVRATPEPSEELVKQIAAAAKQPPSELSESTAACARNDTGVPAEPSSRAARSTRQRSHQPPARLRFGLALIRSLLAELLWQHISRLLSPLLTSRGARRPHGHPRRPS